MCLALLISVFVATNSGMWSAEVYRWGIATLVVVLATGSVQRRGDLWLVASGLGAGILGSLVVALYQVLIGYGPQSFTQRGVIRADGFR